ncbi:MAG TPA: hypothetical protein VHS97_09405 [Isosphaeraceae bacterium]|jgi:hypothetical protein|nr:hypothetical protein [Isosphaeraceae bacterium]
MNTLSLRTIVRNAAAVFSGSYGAITRQAEQAGCSRQTVYDHAHQLEQRLQLAAPPRPPAEIGPPTPAPSLDESTQQRLAVTAFAMGISTRQIEDLLRVILSDEGPDHATIGRWVAEAAKAAKPVLEILDAACIPQVQTLVVDEIFFGGDRPWSESNRRA